VRNPKAYVALCFGLLALAFLAAGGLLPRFRPEIGSFEALVVVPAAVVAALLAIAMARRAQFDYQRTLGRVGGNAAARLAKVLAAAALLVSLAAGLALGVYGVLLLVQS
jgi:hypothetical protein